MAFGEIGKEEIESAVQKLLDVLKCRAEQVFMKEESRRKGWESLLKGIGRLERLGYMIMRSLKSTQRKKGNLG